MAVNPQESADAQFLSLSPRAQKYMDTAIAVAELRELAAAHPEDAEQYAPGIDRGEVIMCITESAAAEDFVAVVEVQEPQARASRRQIIESVRDDPDFGTVITEEDIQSQLDALPPFDDYHPDVRRFVGGYFEAIGEWLIAVDGEAPAKERDGSTQPDGASGDGEGGIPADPEAKVYKPPLTITVYKDQVIQLGEDGQMISLMRSMDIPKTTQEELYIAEARLAALRLVAGHETEQGQKGLSSNDVWKSYAGDAKLNSTQHRIVSDFLESLQIEGEPVLNIHKPTEKSRDYSNGGFDITFVEVDEESGLEQDTIFRLPNGEMLFGKRARVAHMLMRASKDQPVSLQDLLDSDVYTDEEKAEMSDTTTALSGMVSFLRQRLQQEELLVADEGPKHGYVINSAKRSETDKSFVYWMEYKGEGGENGDDRQGVVETGHEHEQSIAHCRMVADWLVENEAVLVRLGYKPFDAGAQAALQTADTAETDPEISRITKAQRLRLVFDAVRIITSFDSSVEELIEKMHDNDVRWPVVDYLLSATGEDDKITLNRLVEDFPEIDFAVDGMVVELDRGLATWPSHSEREKEEIAELSYNLFDRIGNGVQKRNNVNTASPTTIIPEVDKLLIDNNLPPLTTAVKAAFINAHNHWIRSTKPSSSARVLRRAWGKSLRAELNRATRPH